MNKSPFLMVNIPQYLILQHHIPILSKLLDYISCKSLVLSVDPLCTIRFTGCSWFFEPVFEAKHPQHSKAGSLPLRGWFVDRPIQSLGSFGSGFGEVGVLPKLCREMVKAYPMTDPWCWYIYIYANINLWMEWNIPFSDRPIQVLHRCIRIYMLTFGVYWWDPCYHV